MKFNHKLIGRLIRRELAIVRGGYSEYLINEMRMNGAEIGHHVVIFSRDVYIDQGIEACAM